MTSCMLPRLFVHKVPPHSHCPISYVAYKAGQKVEYQAIGGGNVENSTTTGTIVEVITEPEVY